MQGLENKAFVKGDETGRRDETERNGAADQPNLARRLPLDLWLGCA
jgi:hypothetical protein